MKLHALSSLLLTAPPLASAIDNGVARTPALGWSSWNYFEDDINETLIEGIAQGMVSSGLRDAGYEYVNLDAGAWAPKRSPSGQILADPAKFPSGMAALASKVHALKLKFGVYTDLSNKTAGYTCGTGPGSYGHYESDAATFAAIGADFLKVDYCAYDQQSPARFHPSIPDQLTSWQELRDALNKTGRPIYSYFCPRSFGGSLVPPDPTTGGCLPNKRCIVDGPPHAWTAETRMELANTILTEYHNSGDEWQSAMSNLDAVLDLRPQPDAHGPGFFSDGDMLHTCSFGAGKRGKVGMKQHEYTAQFATWAVLSSPIIISADLRSLHRTQPACLNDLLKNSEILAVHQDAAANAPRVIFTRNATMVRDEHGGLAAAVAAQGFARKMADGSVALVLLNRKDTGSLTLSASWSELGLPAGAECSVRDLINKKQLTKAKASFSAAVPSHSASFVRVACG